MLTFILLENKEMKNISLMVDKIVHDKYFHIFLYFMLIFF